MTPYFSSFQDFVQMQGHGAFVWACYGISFFALLALIVYAKKERKATIDRLRRQAGAQSTRLTNKQRQALGADNDTNGKDA